VLVTRGDGYALVLPRATVDAHAFADAVRAAAGAPDDEAVRLLDAALAAWHDGPYADVADVGDLAPVVARLEELRLAALERLAAARLALGAGAELVPELTALAAADPLRERTAVLLGQALYRAGRQGEALDVLRRTRERVADELGLDASAELRDLETAILRQDPSLSAARRPAGPAATTAEHTAHATVHDTAEEDEVFVGRAAELAALAAAWDDAAAGRGSVVAVTGEPGIGKTRLVEAFARRARARVRWGRCAEFGGAPPYWPWQQVLGGLPEAVPGADTGARFALGVDTARRLRALAADEPLLVVVDDLQWADRDSLHVLEVVLGQLRGSRVLLALTCREEATADPAVARVLGVAARVPGGRRLALGALPESEVADLVGRLRGGAADPGVVQALARRSGGNPFFATELAALRDRDDVPAGVRSVVRIRLDDLPGPAREVLAVAAVAGRDLSVGLLTAALAPAGLAPGAVEAALVAGMLHEPAPGRVRVAHDLVREVLLEELGPVRRADLHARLADALEAGPAAATSTAAIAVHRSEAAAGAPDRRAAAACAQAASEALARAGAEEAVALAGRGLAHAPPEDPALQADLHLARGEALRRLGLLESSGDDLAAAARIARAAGDRARVARAAVASAGGGVGGYWACVGAPQATDVRLLEEAAGDADALDPPLRSAVLAAAAVQRASSGAGGGEDLAARALETAGDDPRARARATVAAFVAAWTPAAAAERVALARGMLRGTAGDPAAEATALHLLRCALVETVQVDEAASVSRRYSALAARRGDGDLLLLDAWWAAGLALARGEVDEARRLADLAVADAPTTSPAAADVTRMSRQTIEGIAAWHDHRMPALVPEVVDLAATVDHDWLAVLAQAHAQAGRRTEALAAVDRMLTGPGEGTREPVHTVLLSDVYLELGAAERAESLLPALESYGDTVVVLWPGTTVLGPSALYRGGIKALLGRRDAADDLHRAVQICDAFGFAPFRRRAERLLAGR
jgi:DNA-binding SARP family transcriptional activator